MSCWVVPTIAAEIWGVPLQQLLTRIGKGEVPTKLEHGFMFVNLAPDGPVYQPKRLAPGERPQTFTAVSDEEILALTSDEWTAPASESFDDELDEDLTDEDLTEEIEDETSLPAEEPEPPVDKGDWRSARRETGRLRVPPPRMPKQAAA